MMFISIGLSTLLVYILLHFPVEIAVSQKASKLQCQNPYKYLYEYFQKITGIVTYPQSMNVSLNGFAIFNCTAIASFISWEIDGVLINGDIRDKGFDDTAPVVTLDAAQDLRGTSLRVLGSPDSNNVSITCVAIIPITHFTNDVNTSEPALMLVQGEYAYQHMFRIVYMYNSSQL